MLPGSSGLWVSLWSFTLLDRPARTHSAHSYGVQIVLRDLTVLNRIARTQSITSIEADHVFIPMFVAHPLSFQASQVAAAAGYADTA